MADLERHAAPPLSAVAEAEPRRVGATALSGDRLRAALDYDLSRPIAFAALALLYVISRLPFINISYGTDPDAWRVALSGYWLWDHGEFYPSRLPGYPLHEYASAAVVQGGWLATNSLTLLISIIGLWFFAGIVRELQLPNRGLLVAGFAFTPLLWINSMTTMDYMWALTFILASYYFLLRDETGAAGLMLGLATASRLSSLIMIVPFLVYLWRDGKRGETRDFVTWSIAVPVIAYVPIVWRYGPQFLGFYDAEVGYLNVLRLLGKDVLGILGALAVLAAAAVSLPRLRWLPRDFLRDKDVMVWVVAIAAAVLVFSRLPHEAAYLIPLFPFGYFVMARYFHRWALAGAIGAIVLAGFVDFTTPGEDIDRDAVTGARVGRGLVLSNRETMQAQLDFVDEIEGYDIADGSVVSLGFVYPMFAVLNRDRLEIGILEKDKDAVSQLSDKGQAHDPTRNITYVWLVDYDLFEDFRKKNRIFAYTEDAGRSTAALYEYRPGLFGARLIDLGRGPSGNRGAARTDR